MSFDPELFGKAMGDAIREAVDPLRAEIAVLRKQLDEVKAAAPDARQLVADEVAKIPVPENGKDADESAIAERVAQTIKTDLERWKTEAQGAIEVPELPDIKGMVESAVSEAVKAIPAPQDGKSITIDDVRPILDDAIKQLRQDADEAIAEPLKQAESARDTLIKAVGELRQPEDGKSVTVDDVRQVLDSAIAESKAALNAATKQAQDAAQKAIDTAASLHQPEDGKSVTLDDVMPTINLAMAEIYDQISGRLKDVHQAIESAEQAAKLATDKAESLRQPEDGKSIAVDDVRLLIEREIEKAVRAIPVPTNGKDGIGLAGMLIDRGGSLIATMTNGEVKSLGSVVGKDAAPIDSLEITQTERLVTLRLGSVERTIKLDTILDRGVWEQGAYDKGDAVTYGGSLWIAQQDTDEAPGTSKAWRLAVKRGRDGRDLRDSASKHNKDSGVAV